MSTWLVPERARRAPVIALVRMAIVLVILAGEGDQTRVAERTDGFYWLLAVAGAYALAALVLAWLGWRPRWLA